MILVTVGTQKFPFNRLLKKVDSLIEQGIITDSVTAQIGYSDYHPLHYSYVDFISEEKFDELIKNSDILLTHGGIGTIIKGLLLKKKVIIIPRMKEYKEHVDNHQIEIGERFSQMEYTLFCKNIEELSDMIKDASVRTFREFHFSWYHVARYIQNYLNNLEEDKR